MSQPQKRKASSQTPSQPSKPSSQSNTQSKKPATSQKSTLTKPTNTTKPSTTISAPLTPKLPADKRGWEWYKSIGSPRLVLSPMVGQSELTFRQLLRSHGAQLTYTPMIISSQYVADPKYRTAVFTYDPTDRPLVVQLCATNPADFLSAAQLILATHEIDAIELNLGCPQGVAERGGYGSWMMEHLPDVQEILTKAVHTLPIPITAKIRIFPSLSQTLAYTQMLANCGISLLTVHPRLRSHREEVLSSWDIVSQVRSTVSIPVVLNGDIWGPSDLAMGFCVNQVDGFMCAQGALQMPSIFKTISEFVDYNRPLPQHEDASLKPSPSTEDDGATASSTSNKKQKTNTTTAAPASPSTTPALPPLPEAIQFQSTLSGPLAQPKSCNHWRLRKYLTTVLSKQSQSLPKSTLSDQSPSSKSSTSTEAQTATDKAQNSINDKITQIYATIPQSARTAYADVIKSYQLTPTQQLRFNSNPMHAQFVTVILHLEAAVDPCKRQLQNAVEYLRFAEKYPVHHPSIAQRHLFFILFDLVNKHLDCYDLLYVAQDSAAYKEVIHKLHQKAVAGLDFQGCDKNNYFLRTGKERNRRRDGTLAPPPWPVGGGGFNVACNAGPKDANKAGKAAADAKSASAEVKPKHKVDMSKFD